MFEISSAMYRYGLLSGRLLVYMVTASLILFVLKSLYNLFLHPLRHYPGPLLWRASRIPYSYHSARGDLFRCIDFHHRKYGPTVRLAPSELSFTAPGAWKEIYVAKPQLPKSPYVFPPDDPDLPEGILSLNDVEHARVRKQLGPAFTGNSIQEIEPLMQEYTDLLISQLDVARKEGPQNMVLWFSWCLSDVIGHLAMGVEFGSLRRRQYHEWPGFFLNSLKITIVINQIRRAGLWGLFKAMIPSKALEDQQKFVNATLDYTRQRLKNGNLSGKQDLVGMLLREMKNETRPLTEKELAANTVALVAAGSETTSVLLTNIVRWLGREPAVLKKLTTEIRESCPRKEDLTIKNILQLPYLLATVEEGLRLDGPTPMVTPRITPKGQHFMIDGQAIPPDTDVSVSIWHIAHSPAFFEDAERFEPERWLAGSTMHQVKDAFHPFSLGVRNCIGKQLAYTESRLVLAKLLWNFDIELDGPHDGWAEGNRAFILWELQPLMVKLTPAKH